MPLTKVTGGEIDNNSSINISSYSVTGVATFSGGPVLIGSGTSTGTASQRLQVTGDAYVSGNLGVGITNPGSTFTVKGSAIRYISNFDNNTGVYLSAADTLRPNISLRVSDNSERGKIEINGVNGASGDRLGLYAFSGGNINEVVSILGGGTVGIGTINPAAKLHVLGNAIRHQATNPYIEFYQLNGTNTGYIQSRTTDFRFNSVGSIPVTFGTNDVERVRIDGSGNLGIGTNVYSCRLSVFGSTAKTSADAIPVVFSSNDGSNPFQLIFQRTASTDSVPAWTITSVEQGVSYRSLSLQPNGGNTIIGMGGGNLGIGTANPAAKLHVRVGTNANFTAQLTNNITQLQSINDAANAFTRLDIAGSEISLSPSSVEAVRINSSGNIGIGTISPTSARLDVWAGGTSSGFPFVRIVNIADGPSGGTLSLNKYGSTAASFGPYSANNVGVDAVFTQLNIGTQSNHPLVLYTNNVERVRIDGSGNLGIGTANPSMRLHVFDQSDTVPARIQSNGGDSSLGFKAAADANSYNTRCGSYQGSGFGVWTGNTVRTVVNNSGDLQIVNGNLVIGTSGKGIDFSAVTNAPGMTSELLDDYEEGTWTPTLINGGTCSVAEATYTKIGRLVSIYAYLTNVTPTNNGSTFQIGGLPFTNKAGASYHCGSLGFAGTGNLNDWRPLVEYNNTFVYFHVVSGSNIRRTNANFVTLNNNGELLFNVTYNTR